ncbi:MAG: 4-hydroxy-3-methylbut-2-enyl diphosphate reductase [Desulfosarcinaceae bacterium]|nr:4-hydroxy-3-methylbut-2-enyl diphosphate reductase [Desulfosarcinaceae bacterium]
MKITLAKTAGFCMGVRRAVELALDAPNQCPPPIYTFGPLIHNPQVLDTFTEKGIDILQALPALPTAGAPPPGAAGAGPPCGTVIIRAHGVPPDTRDRLEAAGYAVIDATCPRVIRVQTIIRVHHRKGYSTIIVGDEDHPEVVGLLGYAGDRGHVVKDLAELKALPALDQAIVVAQTTQNTAAYEEIAAWLADTRPHYKFFNTICDSTAKRQDEVRCLADQADAVVVVGGKESGNTQRLAELVRQSGKPAYHVETEAELDPRTMADYDRVAVTAGASTPNWIIKRVFRSLEKVPMTQEKGWLKAFFSLQQGLLLTNCYVALGAGCLCYACSRLLGVQPAYPAVPTAILYVLSMHMLNHLTGRAENRFNDPDREAFYHRNKLFLSVAAVLAGALGLMAAVPAGRTAFLLLLAMSLTGLSYNLRIFPCQLHLPMRYCRIKDLPGSKTILIAVAWGVVTVVLPQLGAAGGTPFSAGLVFLWAAGLVFARTAFFDILDIQGDRIVGKETLPIFIGERRVRRLLERVLLAACALLLVGSVAGLVSSLGYLLAFCPLFLLIVTRAHHKGYMLPGIRLEFGVESLFVLTGVITFIWVVVAM